MSLFLFLTVVQALVAAALVGIVLIQRSEGGGLGVGGGSGNPGGLMSARGAADFLTRTTKWLAVVFVVLAIVMAAVAVKATSGGDVDDTGSIGLLLPNTECKLLDDDGREVKVGEPGELFLRGPQVCLGYWRNEAATKETLGSDGWLKTGDVAVCNEKGLFWIVDRKKVGFCETVIDGMLMGLGTY